MLNKEGDQRPTRPLKDLVSEVEGGEIRVGTELYSRIKDVHRLVNGMFPLGDVPQAVADFYEMRTDGEISGDPPAPLEID